MLGTCMLREVAQSKQQQILLQCPRMQGLEIYLPGRAGRLGLRAGAALLVAAVGRSYGANATAANRADAAVVSLVELSAADSCIVAVDEHNPTSRVKSQAEGELVTSIGGGSSPSW